MNLSGINIDAGTILSGAGTLFKNLREAITGEAILDPNKRAELLAQAQKMEADLEAARIGIMVAEASSPHGLVALGRPLFLYLFYFVVLILAIIAPFVGIFFPSGMAQFYINVENGFKAVPEAMWWTFTTGYLGYVGARQYGKVKGSDK
jgi:hypothetical protein